LNRKRKLKVAILRILMNVKDTGYTLRTDELHNELILTARPAPFESETRELVEELDREKRIIMARDDDVVRVAISPSGEVWFKQETGH